MERSRFPRHKVCGEFLSPEIEPLLQRIGLWDDFKSAAPHRYSRLGIYFAKASKTAMLAEPAYGLSRFRLDSLLMESAQRLGAMIVASEPAPIAGPVISARGRAASAPKGGRLFGFKAHFTGPVSDAIELYFFDRCYVGVNCVEAGITNVCGIAPEEILRMHGFQPDALLANFPPLRDRTRALDRSWPWLTTGPLVFGRSPGVPTAAYPAGDALSFADPFTGSGMVNAIWTGMLAAGAAAEGAPVARHISRCISGVRTPAKMAGVIRWAVWNGLAESLVRLVPLGGLMRWTRPRMRE